MHSSHDLLPTLVHLCEHLGLVGKLTLDIGGSKDALQIEPVSLTFQPLILCACGVCVFVCVCVCVCVWCMSVCVRVHVHMYMYVLVFCLCICVRVFVCVCASVRMCVYCVV